MNYHKSALLALLLLKNASPCHITARPNTQFSEKIKGRNAIISTKTSSAFISNVIMVKIAVNGFGRIGRLVVRRCCQKQKDVSYFGLFSKFCTRF